MKTAKSSNSNDSSGFNDRKTVMGLDRFGFPAPAIANSILVRQETFGDSSQELEVCWYKWLHYNPFDSQVAGRLVSMYEERLTRLDQSEDREQYQLLERKLELTENRAQRYRQERFRL